MSGGDEFFNEDSHATFRRPRVLDQVVAGKLAELGDLVVVLLRQRHECSVAFHCHFGPFAIFAKTS